MPDCIPYEDEIENGALCHEHGRRKLLHDNGVFG